MLGGGIIKAPRRRAHCPNVRVLRRAAVQQRHGCQGLIKTQSMFTPVVPEHHRAAPPAPVHQPRRGAIAQSSSRLNICCAEIVVQSSSHTGEDGPMSTPCSVVTLVLQWNLTYPHR